MTCQIVVQIVQIATKSGNRYLVELERAPNVSDFGNVELFECDPATLPPWDAPDAVRHYGKSLMTKLLGAHPLVKKAVEYALELGPADDCPIFIYLKNSLDAEQLCWETLCDDKGRFLALDKRWQVARMAGTPQLVPKDPVEFRLPLKVMAILSATGVDAAPEWEAFYKAVQGARNTGLPICVDAVIGDEPVFDKVNAIKGDLQLTCTPLTNQNDIYTRIDNFGPNIVHFFCHGSADYGDPRLELANFNDAASHSSVHLRVDDLLTNAGVRDAWLVTLNCCEGGAATRGVHSLAYSLVSKGVYAAVGMLEAVDALDAHEFCTYFYPAIFGRLRKIAQSVQMGSGEPLDWVNALYAPRVALRDRHSDPNLTRQWALPVLIVQPQPLRVHRGPVVAAGVPPSQDEKRGHEETIQGLLATIPPEKMQEFLNTLTEIRAGAKFEAMDDLPASLTINAWTGAQQPVSGVAAKWWLWAVARHQVERGKYLAAPPQAKLKDWRDERVGWGLVLPDNDTLSEGDRATGTDVPAELRPLLEIRKGAPILRYRLDAGGENLRRYYTDRPSQSLALSGSQRGTAAGHLPYYLLIYGSPAQIPWEFQYLLNGPCYTGRIDLTGEALSNYITALVNDWKDAQAKADHPVTWAVDKGSNDITHLMRYLIAEPVCDKLESDPEMRGKTRHFAAANATVKNLAGALAEPDRTPALIVTTSHGMTGPLDRPDLMSRDLGLPVDANSEPVRPEVLLGSWQPDGAIWYAHACCSAGSDRKSAYAGLVPTGSPVEQVLLAVAGLGAQVAPLPRALLGAKRPLRAFIGHVEPTFDWTIRNPESKQALTDTIIQALYNHLYQEEREPVGFAFSETFALIGQLFQQWSQAQKASLDADKTIRERNRAVALRTQLTALDRQACVILGDPTVALPAIAKPQPGSGAQ